MIKLIKSTFYKEKETKKLLSEFILHSNQLSFGRECEKFEKNFAKYQQRKYCVFVNSGSSANLALIQALLNSGKLKKGDKIGFSSVTWATNVMPLIELGLSAVPIDVELETLNVSSRTLNTVLEKTPLNALLITNLLGLCDDLDAVVELCKRKNILLLEDTCEALGSIYKNKKLGNFGFSSTFSFYVGHHLSTIEGGAISTDDKEFASMLQIVRAHGWDRNLSSYMQIKMRSASKINSPFYSRYTFYDLGYNFRSTEIAGFIGNRQLRYIRQANEARQKNFLRIARQLYKNSDLYYPLRYEHLDFFSNFAIPLVCKTRQIRDALVAKCKNRVEIRPIVGGDITSQPFYKKNTFSPANNVNTNAKIIHNQGLYFGNNPELTEREINILIRTFQQI